MIEYADLFDWFIIVCFVNTSFALFVDQLTDRLLIYLLINQSNEWLIDLSMEWLVNQLFDRLLIVFFNWLINWFIIDRFIGTVSWLINPSSLLLNWVCQLIDWSID